MKIVLDTNIVMDMLHFANVHTTLLQGPISSGQWQCFTDAECFAELKRVCTYPEFALEAAQQDDLLERYRQFVSVCNASTEENYPLPRCRDPDDQKFLILAARCQADVLVTRDKLLLRLAGHKRTPPGFAIMTAEAACKLLLAPKHPA
jgi:putative PIN family toxin of toxin-antitoxin system